MNKIFSFLTKLALSILFTLLLIEVGLRLLPQLVPLPLLIYFAEQPRAEIAQRRNLPTQWGTVVVERDDGGPELRIFKPFTTMTLPGHDDLTITMDQIGFCNPAGVNYETDRFDMIVIGDSFTTCHGVKPEDMWSTQLADLADLSVYNLGRGKIGVHEYLQILKKFGLSKSPRIVLMNIYEGNDLRDATLYYHYRLKYGGQNPAAPPAADQPASGLLQNYSYAYNLAAAFQEYETASMETINRTDPFFLAIEGVPQKYLVGLNQINFKYDVKLTDKVMTINRKNADTDEVQMARLVRDKVLNPGVWQSLEEALGAFVALSKQYHFVPVVSYSPSAHIAYANSIIYEDPSLYELMPWLNQELRAFFRKEGQELGYTFIDLTPALQAAAQNNDSKSLLYSRADLHFSRRGHRVVAEALNQALQKLKLLAHH